LWEYHKIEKPCKKPVFKVVFINNFYRIKYLSDHLPVNWETVYNTPESIPAISGEFLGATCPMSYAKNIKKYQKMRFFMFYSPKKIQAVHMGTSWVCRYLDPGLGLYPDSTHTLNHASIRYS
jgi:hypothetical protein